MLPNHDASPLVKWLFPFAANGVYSATRDRQNAQLETLLMTLAPQEHKS